MFGRTICASALLFLMTAAQTRLPVDSWPMFRGSSSLRGVSETPLPAALKLRWTYEAKDSIESSAAIAGDTVYVGSMDGSLHAVDLQTGKARWIYKTAGPVQESSPCVQDGTVYVGDLSATLHAVDAATGQARWTFKAADEIRSSPNCSGGRIYFGSYDQHLYCLSTDGSLIWKFETQGPVHGTPAIDQGRVYISGCDETFRMLDAASGKQIAALPLDAYAGASAALRDGGAYVGTFGNEILGLDLDKRAVRWRYQHPTRNFPFYSSAAVTTDRVIIGGRDKLVHCLERMTGKEVWSFTTGARVESSPAVTGSRIFIGSNDGTLYELEMAGGKKLWEFAAGAPLSASPAIARGAMVIGSQDGLLYCFGEKRP